ncbi:MAG: cytochrome c3 family protein, partial [Desulfobulbaceae bacterium]|nr:cytochrome c3 family protein [Desulfobulbaceae bacterium]
MKLRNRNSVFLLAILLVIVPLTAAYAQGKFKLKEGAAGTICLECHEGLQEKMKKPFVHSPLADGDCIGCHNPHTSNYEMLMAAPADTICYTCHDSVVPEDAQSVHQVVADGQCNLCHDPHASENKFNLLHKDSDLCYECHQSMADRTKEVKYTHPPVRDNCLDCHDAHASGKNAKLLDDPSPALCLQCHETDKETFK